MNKQGNTYTFIYSIILVVIVAVLLSVIALWLQPTQNENIENEKRQNILRSVNITSTPENSKELFDKYITRQFIVNSKGEEVAGNAFTVDLSKEVKKSCEERQLPVYVANIDGVTKYILPLQGTGLWGPIWGYISLNADKNTVYGTVFDHKGETPGLGAEITQDRFRRQFDGKTIFNNGNLVSILVKKGGGATGPHEVDAISGGTITSKGVESMLKNYLTCYEPFLKK
ncbi:NADH:ubiquinone reductase (Na(+)-transporting) subunit C [uncultured Sanguibacteroides sp.]|uniref:NADH:ubiquinone reductase (Na(+)-transporting) subunit C n=1 Tax=uncultured Sanguibacteroides sp. TaxID=1635151 RepID=UPI0025F38280|nr:NADH:ubiquinone reductase (Na(+)-transporting) subunit C [uncultured Sanguibacteroides sp.]